MRDGNDIVLTNEVPHVLGQYSLLKCFCRLKNVVYKDNGTFKQQ